MEAGGGREEEGDSVGLKSEDGAEICQPSTLTPLSKSSSQDGDI